MSANAWIWLGGLHSLAFAAFHMAFWKLFGWRRSLQTATVADRAILQILNLRLIYVLLGIAALCFFYTDELQDTALGRAVLVGMSLFWIGRTIEQFVFLRINRPMVHVLTALFVLGAVIFAMPLLV
ncbi:putative membrane protein [Lysobacter antibioticus]|uniref:MAPEG family protein n=1 Tax=Lysobacter antibioticus TaxID=84531 RepID=A0A0S2F7U7_LYSAN|nr:hypothetical protein [Lysobacter antibioticus]ALN65199.1 putative membrane protein [Lysobacter antibioticus]ALN79630.1 hypothetical protein LA76x_1474 [Lysobacter antibioticus]